MKTALNGMSEAVPRRHPNVLVLGALFLTSSLFHPALHAQEEKIALQHRSTNAGVEARILLAECPGPAEAGYTLEAARLAMQLMDAVLHNRLEDPKSFMAPGATSLTGIVKAKGQFQGFEGYPNYSLNIKRNIEALLHIANNSKDQRNADYAAFLKEAIAIADSVEYADPSPGKLVAWRTAGSGSPGEGFRFYRTVLGNDFYYQ
jgi:hypothetical protein